MGDYGMVMPFVSVASKGGPWDDAAYCAGYAMGLLDAELRISIAEHVTVVRTPDVGQADLIAMRYGWTMTATPTDDDEWVNCEFRQEMS